jgi:hypothetical protein
MAEKKTYSIDDPSFGVNGFCAAEQISRSALYKMWKQGIGPDYYLVGTRKRIPHRARLEFHQKRMAAAKGGK